MENRVVIYSVHMICYGSGNKITLAVHVLMFRLLSWASVIFVYIFQVREW